MGARRAVYKPKVVKHLKRRAAARPPKKRSSVQEELRRARGEAAEARAQQAATAEILKVIASFPGDVQPVFEAIVRSALQLIGGNTCSVTRLVQDHLHLAAFTSTDPSTDEEYRALYPQPIGKRAPALEAIRTGKPQFVADVPARMREFADPATRKVMKARRVGSLLLVPLVREGTVIGMIHVARAERGSFSATQVGLVEAFADQAVIAIHNARLFNETKEALERQTATAEILKVIASSPSDVQPVFEAIEAGVLRLLEADGATVSRIEGDTLFYVDAKSSKVNRTALAIPVDNEPNLKQMMRERRPVIVDDVEIHPGTTQILREIARAREFRSLAHIPMMRGDAVIGMIGVERRAPGGFTVHEVGLLQTFADQAVIAIENARLFNETNEALEQQRASAAVLSVISNSVADAQPVFEKIAESCERLFAGKHTGILLVRGAMLHFGSHRGPQSERFKARYPMPMESTAAARAIAARAVVQYPDIFGADDVPDGLRLAAESTGARSAVIAPMLSEGRAIGTLYVARGAVGEFSPKEVALLKTFADQAVIAIENARLFNETKEALERQTATAEILKVIASSPSDVQPVFDAIAESALRLIGGLSATVTRVEGDMLHLAAKTTVEEVSGDAVRRFFPVPAARGFGGEAIRTRLPVCVSDIESDPRAHATTRELARLLGWKSVIVVPMIRADVVVGLIHVQRREAGPFSDHHVRLLQTFAAQAVIAIENARLFNETKEALERQTATAQILAAMSGSMTDLKPVFEAIAKSCSSLFKGSGVALRLLHDGVLHVVARIGMETGPVPVDRGSAVGVCVLDARTMHFPDIEAVAEEFPRVRELGLKFGYRSGVYAPLLRGGEAIGTIAVLRPIAGAFDEEEVALLKTFADQAVIAIENVRLFNETKEALERQTATAEILKVIASSPSDVQPVFDAIVRSCQRLFGGHVVVVTLVSDGEIVPRAAAGELDLKDLPAWPLDRESGTGACILDARTINIADTHQVVDTFPRMKDLSIRLGYRSGLYVPLHREGGVLGSINIVRQAIGAFSEREVSLAETFADQAVIAIENVRLFKETKEALQRQTATADILNVIASSPADVVPVFNAIAESAARLCDAVYSAVLPVGNGMLHIGATYNWTGEGFATGQRLFPMPVSADHLSAIAVRERRIIVLDNLQNDPSVPTTSRELAVATGYNSLAIVPMVREGASQGALVVARRTPFSRDQVALLQTFADQAVIAIENVRLFKETQEALERQTATAEILRVIASSPSDVQPVFDAIVTSALKLCGGLYANAFRYDGESLQFMATTSNDPAWRENVGAALKAKYPMRPDASQASGRVILTGTTVRIEDLALDPHYDQALFRSGGPRRMLAVPMLREGAAVGVIVVAWAEPGPIVEHHEVLLRTFADQAVIAIENVRLFRELRSRTEALTKSIGQLQALGEVSQALSSTLDVEKVLATIVSRAVQLTGLERGAIYEYDDAQQIFRLRGGVNVRQEIIDLNRNEPIRMGDGFVGRAASTRAPVQVPDLEKVPRNMRARDVLLQIGARALLAVPLVREGHVLGALAVTRSTPGDFAPEVIALLETFATQSAIAIQNARLFREIEEKGRQLEVASQHKSQFLASMSHELRTPLNAILGFNEMILDQVYGEISEDVRAPLENMQTSGKHLLRLINNVLDLAKIEAGRMELALADYSVEDTVGSVHSTLKPLAAEKGIEFLASVPGDLPLAYGDGGRITQCLMNLAGNSLKFTKAGKVEIAVAQRDALLRYSVADTGIGISPDKIASLFTEFKQTDATIASEYGGTGLGLSITKKFIEMHGGHIWVESEPGKGSTFLFEIPLRVER